MKTYFITGISGFLGRNLTIELLKQKDISIKEIENNFPKKDIKKILNDMKKEKLISISKNNTVFID